MANKYPGYCIDCRADVSTGHGELKKDGSRWVVACGRSSKVPSIPEGTKTYEIGGGSGYGCDGWTVGQVVRAAKREIERGYPAYLYVLRAKSQRVREDGLSFGVGDDSGYLYHATCREATAEEAAPVMSAQRRAEAIKQAKQQLDALKRQIQEHGERPAGDNALAGERLFDTQTIYGGGDWFIIEPEHIWYVRNNGSDGDNWSANNVRTGGAGAIGWRVPRTDRLMAALYALRDLLAGAIENEARERELLAMIQGAHLEGAN